MIDAVVAAFLGAVLAASPGVVEFPAPPSREASSGLDASSPLAPPVNETGLLRVVLPPDPTSPPAGSVSGVASWYRANGLIAAAGPALRTGDWRGSVVTVRGNGRSVTVTLSDWCQCYGSRVIDLSDDAFRQLAPLSRGLVKVTIDGAMATLPPTDQ